MVLFWEVTLAVIPNEMYSIRSALHSTLLSERLTMLTLFLWSYLRYREPYLANNMALSLSRSYSLPQ